MSNSARHESAHLHVQGLATYIDDLPLTEGSLHAAPILSTVASGRILSLDLSAVLSSDGVRSVVTADDIPGDKLLSSFTHDEPVFANQRVEHIGQVLGLVVADTHLQARAAAQLAVLKVEADPPLLNARDAQSQNATVLPRVHVARGNSQAQMQYAPHHIQGQLEIGGQEHYYLEGQIAYALPQDNGEWLIHSSTQHPGEAQHWVAHALHIPLHQVRVLCRRMGGGFGGKETQSGHLAVWAAIAAQKTGQAVKSALEKEIGEVFDKPTAFTKIAALYAATPVATLQAWQAFHTVDDAAPRPTRPRNWCNWLSPNRSACSITISEALGTSTPTSMTVVLTNTPICPCTNSDMTAFFSACGMRECSKPIMTPGSASHRAWCVSVALRKSSASLSSISGHTQ